MKDRYTSEEYRRMIDDNDVSVVSDLINKEKIDMKSYKLSSNVKKIDCRQNKRLIAIDPGNIQSAYCVIEYETLKPIEFGKVENKAINGILMQYSDDNKCEQMAIEMIASYGMAVGKEVFDTCVWIGRYIEQARTYFIGYDYVYRKDVKIALCGTTRANDSNIRQALIDRFGIVGTKKEPGYFYGFAKDVWSAYAVGITYLDKIKLESKVK
jgi:hypothetical protein